MASDATPARISSLLAAGATERSEAYTLIDASADVDKLGCVPHLCRVMKLSADDVPPDEFVRAVGVLVSAMVRGTRACGEVLIEKVNFWTAEDSALARVLGKKNNPNPSLLSQQDVLVLGAAVSVSCTHFATGVTYALAEVGQASVEVETADITGPYWAGNPLFVDPDLTPSFKLRLVRLALQLLVPGTPLRGRQRAHAWDLIFFALRTEKSICRWLLEDAESPFLDFAVSTLRTATPAQWLSVRRSWAECDEFNFTGIFPAVKDAAEAASAAGFDPMPVLLRSGFFDCCVEAVVAFEAAQAGGPATRWGQEEGHVNVALYFFGVCWSLSLLDFSAYPEAVAKIRGVADALAYAMRHEICQYASQQLTTVPWITILVANVFGRDESGEAQTITMSQSDINSTLFYCREMLLPRSWGAAFPYVLSFSKALRSLCIR